MTSEEIIQRLLDEKKITVKEAMVILKDLAKIGLNTIKENITDFDWVKKNRSTKTSPNKPIYPTQPVTVMYGVGISDDVWYKNSNTNTITSASTSSIGDAKNDTDKKQ